MISKSDYLEICKLIDNSMTEIYDRPLGNNPRLAITTFGASRLKEQIKEMVDKDQKEER